MAIPRETMSKTLLAEYPWPKDELFKVNAQFQMLHTPMGNTMLGKADMTETRRKSGMEEPQIIAKLTKLIQDHQ